jgi:hypothetical protein
VRVASPRIGSFSGLSKPGRDGTSTERLKTGAEQF